MNDIFGNWQRLQERVAHAADKAGRGPSEITIVAVTKTRTVDEIRAALDAGVVDLGENRVQEAADKRPAVGGGRWHLIGRLQRNKAGKAVEVFDCLQSVDNLRLAQSLARRAETTGCRRDILLQVNTSGAEHQAGIAVADLPSLAETVANLPALQIRGLMTIAALSPDRTVVGACFERLRRCREELSASHPSLDLSTLSMGMSGDFEMAIAAGSTMVRIGTAIFGPHPRAMSGPHPGAMSGPRPGAMSGPRPGAMSGPRPGG